MAHPQVAIFARLAKGGDQPVRVIAGQESKLTRTMHDIRYDAKNDEIFVTNTHAQAILAFRGDVNGDQAPVRIIQGPKTQLDAGDRLDVDPVHDEIFIPSGDRVLVYPRGANGDVAPLRVIQGPNTMLRQAATLSVDPMNDLLVVGLNKLGNAQNGALIVFNRTDNGNVKPRNVIRGPKSGIVRITQMALNPMRKFIIATQPGEVAEMEPEGAWVGVWNIDDNGDIPPVMRLVTNGKTTLKKPRGVVLDPKHKEVIIADMRLNAVLTFSWPEIF